MQAEHTVFLNEIQEELNTSENRIAVFSSVCKYSNFLNPGLIEHLVMHYGSENLKSKMTSYISRLKEFRKSTPLLHYAKSQPLTERKVEEKFKSLVITYDWENAMLEDVDQFRQQFAPQYGLHDFCVLLVNVIYGSVVLEWMVPAYLADHLRRKLMATKNELFRESKISKVQFDGITIYSSSIEVSTTLNYSN